MDGDAFKGKHWCTIIFYHVKKVLILCIFAYFIFVEAKFKLTKKRKQSSDLYSLLLFYPEGENSLFLLHPAGGLSSLLLYPAGRKSLVSFSLAGKQFDLTYIFVQGGNKFIFVFPIFVSFLPVKKRRIKLFPCK